jgi:hypothetical protein
VREMETCTEHSSVGFKQRAWLNFWLPNGSLQLKFTAECRLFTLMTV